jgi:uncharacterized membrane protein YbhN (UPF0104 family)
MVFYLLTLMRGRWEELLLFRRALEPLPLFLSVQLLVVYHFILAFLFKQWIGLLGGELPWVKSFKVIYISQMARFLPGGIWGYVGLVYMGGREGVRKGTVILASAGHTGLSLINGAFLALLILPLGMVGLEWRLLPILLMGATAGAVLLPQGIRILDRRLCGEAERDHPKWFLKTGSLVRLSLFYSVHWLLYGVAFWFFLVALGFTGRLTFPGALGALALSGISGLIVPFIPAGLGVREGTLAFLLQPQLGGADAVLVALFSRVWLISVDLICFGLALCLEPGLFLLKKRLG